jgi:hypothetical protein
MEDKDELNLLSKYHLVLKTKDLFSNIYLKSISHLLMISYLPRKVLPVVVVLLNVLKISVHAAKIKPNI